MDLPSFLKKWIKEKHYLPEQVFETEEIASLRTPDYILMLFEGFSVRLKAVSEELPLCVGQWSRQLDSQGSSHFCKNLNSDILTGKRTNHQPIQLSWTSPQLTLREAEWGGGVIPLFTSLMKDIIMEIKIIGTGTNFYSFLKMSVYYVPSSILPELGREHDHFLP